MTTWHFLGLKLDTISFPRKLLHKTTVFSLNSHESIYPLTGLTNCTSAILSSLRSMRFVTADVHFKKTQFTLNNMNLLKTSDMVLCKLDHLQESLTHGSSLGKGLTYKNSTANLPEHGHSINRAVYHILWHICPSNTQAQDGRLEGLNNGELAPPPRPDASVPNLETVREG